MRWLLRKDALILARSRLLVALLIAYPVAIALLIGFAISRSPSRPRVAIVDETPPGQTVQVVLTIVVLLVLPSPVRSSMPFVAVAVVAAPVPLVEEP